MTSSMKHLAVRAILLLVATAGAYGQIIVDNDDGAPGYTSTGGWTQSGSAGYNGGTYMFANVGAASTATWTATLPETKDYEVFVWYVPGGNRATSTKYTINAADGPHVVFINQRAGGFTFDSLGTFPFNAGSASITLDAAGSSGGDVVIADAVRFGADGGGGIDPPDPVEVAPGVWFSEWFLPDPQAVQVLEFDLADTEYNIEMGFAHAKRNYPSKQITTQIAALYDTPGHEVIAAVNASHFDAGIFLHGMHAVGSNVVGLPTLSWPKEIYTLQESNEAFVSVNIPAAVPIVRFADGTERSADVFDYTCGSNTLAIYTTDWAATTGSATQGVEVIVENVNYPLRANKWASGVITAVRTGPASVNNTIPAGGLVIAACTGAESDLLANAVVGQTVSVRVGLAPAELNNAKLIAGGISGWLVKDGEAFPSNWNYGHAPVRHPRTVLAWSGTKHWFVTFDGRQPGYSVGRTYTELADFLVNNLQVDHAVNFDGGGSTTMVVDGQVMNCPSDGATTPCTGTQRAVPNILMLVKRTPTSTLPLNDSFPSFGRSLTWDDKFSMNPVVSFAPAAPSADGYAMHVLNPEGAFETCSVGKTGNVNYVTEAWVYCDYRPELAADGYERVGIFARDSGNANFESTTLGGGNCYALTFDSHDGRIRAGKVVDGTFTDFLEAAPVFETSTAWRRLRIDTIGSTIRYFADGQQLASVNDSTHPHGRCGVGHHAYFATEANVQGAYVDNFSVRGLLFDTDNDGDVDMTDFSWFNFCIKGPKIFYPPAAFCRKLDGDNNGTVDLRDFHLFQQFYTGPL